MLKASAISYFHTRKKLAEALGITPSAVSQWGELVPPLQAARLQELTGGSLTFDPSRYTGWNRSSRAGVAA